MRVQTPRGEVNVGGWGITIEAAVAKRLEGTKEVAK